MFCVHPRMWMHIWRPLHYRNEFRRVVVFFYCCKLIKFYTRIMGPSRFEIAIIENKIFQRLIRNENLSSRSRDEEELSGVEMSYNPHALI